jgi:hypothetical protein
VGEYHNVYDLDGFWEKIMSFSPHTIRVALTALAAAQEHYEARHGKQRRQRMDPAWSKIRKRVEEMGEGQDTRKRPRVSFGTPLPTCQSLKSNGDPCTKPSVRQGAQFCKLHDKSRGLQFLLEWLEEERNSGTYRVLRGRERKEVREHYRRQHADGAGKIAKFSDGTKLGTIDRTVFGDNGAYHELSSVDKKKAKLQIVPAQRFRIKLSKIPGGRVKYLWWTGPGGEKVYEQTGTVRYADYQIGKFYVAPSDVIVD